MVRKNPLGKIYTGHQRPIRRKSCKEIELSFFLSFDKMHIKPAPNQWELG